MKLTKKEFKRRMDIANRPITLSKEEFDDMEKNPDKICNEIATNERIIADTMADAIFKILADELCKKGILKKEK